MVNKKRGIGPNYFVDQFSPKKVDQLIRLLKRESDLDRARLESLYDILIKRVENETDSENYSDYMRGLMDTLGKLLASREPLVKAIPILAKLRNETAKETKAKESLEDTVANFDYEKIQKMLDSQ